MGLFDGMADSPFDKMFDFNHDGKLDMFERAMQFQFLEDEEEDEEDDEDDDDDY